MTPQEALDTSPMIYDHQSLTEMVNILRLLLKVAQAEGAVLAERVKRLEEARKQEREQEDYRPRRENW